MEGGKREGCGVVGRGGVRKGAEVRWRGEKGRKRGGVNRGR